MSAMAAKHVYDVRGRQSMIFRLYCSDKEAFVHMVFYRIAIIFAFILIASMVWSALQYGTALTIVTQRLIIIEGIFFVPQIFESVKALVIIMTKGVVFGELNASFVRFGVKRRRIYLLYRLFPYIVIVLWAALLVWLGIMWLA